MMFWADRQSSAVPRLARPRPIAGCIGVRLKSDCHAGRRASGGWGCWKAFIQDIPANLRVPKTMFSLEISCPPERLDLLIADLWEQGCAGISELDGGLVRAFFEDGAEREKLLARYPDATVRTEAQRDWVEEARELLQPMVVGENFFLVPEWRDDPAPPGRFRITVNPGMAFGTGVHETTQLALEALEKYLRPGMTVLDVGTGSGILAEAAEMLGAKKVFGCDIDADAIAISRQRVAGCFVGSVGAVRPDVAGLALANISPEAIVALAADLMGCVRSGGILLASGFETLDVDQVVAALRAHGQILDLTQKGQWVLAAVTRRS
jgi:ribosomal protein L11 methyltransferase